LGGSGREKEKERERKREREREKEREREREKEKESWGLRLQGQAGTRWSDQELDTKDLAAHAKTNGRRAIRQVVVVDVCQMQSELQSKRADCAMTKKQKCRWPSRGAWASGLVAGGGGVEMVMDG
jgi:hypothetical protein